MSDKKIPVFVGEGPDRIEVGRASVEVLADGTKMVNMSIENTDWGRWAIGGFEPMRLSGIIPPVYKKADVCQGCGLLYCEIEGCG